MTTRLWLWVTGYLVVRFRGQQIENVLDHASRHGIKFWGIERLTTDIMIGRIGVQQFKTVRPLLWNQDVSAAILDRRGLPFAFHKLGQRVFFLLGLGTFCLVVLYLSGFIWFIEINGNEQLPTIEIMNAALDEGLHVGQRRRDFSAKSLESKLLAHFDSLAWVGVSLQGTKVQIDIVERSTFAPSSSLTGNIVAVHDGLVTDLFVLRGTPMVRKGDTVRQGDILISGEYYDLWGRKHHGRAEGAVQARVWYESFAEASLSRVAERKMGGRSSKFLVHIGGWTIPLGFDPSYGDYSTEIVSWMFPRSQSTTIVGLSRINFYEVEYETIPISRDEARQAALLDAWKYVENVGVDLDQVRQHRVHEDLITDGDGIRVHLYVEVEENIARFLPIP